MRKYSFVFMGYLLSSLGGCRDNSLVSGREADAVTDALQGQVKPLVGEGDLDSLLARVGSARYVLLGEASHGTAEFYQWRAAITRRLISEKGFTVVAVEGDWPDAFELNRYLQGSGAPARAREVLQEFNRWPTWMWANEEVAQLADWMRTYNDRTSNRKASFYGLDMYSLWESLERIAVDTRSAGPQTIQLARQALDCLAPYRGDEQAYASATLRGSRCNTVLENLLNAVRTEQGAATPLEQFNREQNALVAVNAERYYYTMVRSDSESWNIRDRHMAATLDRINELHGPDTKVIVWAHNTHVGDARYTDMAPAGMVNLGQLVREAHSPENVYIVGFSTYEGEVIAGDYWGAPAERMRVPAAMKGSWEEILHRAPPESKFVSLQELRTVSELAGSVGQRAIGVVYNPSNERGNYVPTVLPQRYDGFIFIDKTTALHPLDVSPQARKEHSEAPVGSYALVND